MHYISVLLKCKGYHTVSREHVFFKDVAEIYIITDIKCVAFFVSLVDWENRGKCFFLFGDCWFIMSHFDTFSNVPHWFDSDFRLML